MNIEFLQDFFVPVIAGICLCVGFMIKQWEKVPNKYIPTIMGLLGLFIALCIHWGSVTPEIILGGLFSGLASTGLYELFRNVIGGAKDE